MIFIPQIPYRRNFLLYIVSVYVFILAHQTEKNSILSLRHWQQRNGINMPEDELLLEAGKWEISHGGLTGRTAQQFIDHLLGFRKNS